ncbi:MAG: RNA polymerase sigma factor [Bacteroidaceae bacterium]|nr:RNA polymerase sigma factor [Bacteroidaceae bacterium]
MHKEKEQNIIKACMRNDRTAQKALYDHFAPYMMALTLRYVGDADTAQDVVQEAFIKIFGSLHQFTAQGSLGSWVRRITLNAALEFLRSRNVFACIEDDEVMQMPTMNVSVIEKMQTDELMQLIAMLPAGYRTVFNMYAIEGYSHKEIAEQLGIQESSSRSQYIRAKMFLQKKLEKYK